MKNILFLVLLLFFSLKQIKNFLFWTYLWQLKNYHIRRFLAHFSTYKGKRIIFNPISFLKLFVLVLFFINFDYAFVFLIFIYLVEGSASLIEILKRKIICPQKTSKTLFLLMAILTVFFIFLFQVMNSGFSLAVILILIFDIFSPLISSFVILMLQPITVFLRNRTINKAIIKRKSFDNLSVIGITGSYGKTSTKEFLREILSKDFNVIATEKNENSEMGISRFILNKIKEEHEIFICEMGAYSRFGISLLCKIAEPKIGILTGINNQHLATFGSQENIVKTKFELIESLPQEGLAVLNWDNQYIKENFKKEISSVKYSTLEEADIWAEEIKEDASGLSFKVNFPKGESYIFKTGIKGIHNVSNLLACICVAKKLGMTAEEIAERLSFMKDNLLVKKIKNFDVIFSTYSSNYDGIISHLNYLKKWKGEKIIVMPCLIELGSDAKNIHYEIGKKIGEVCDLAIITSRDHEKELKRGANMKESKILFMDDGEKIYEKIFLNSKNNSVILLESRVPIKLIKKINE
jgi:UDP-N-acetylmuramoyl-tripeptide--D-alanyl-D-alanine ligase